MEGSGSSGFDMSKMSTAEKLLAGGSILLLIDSFLPWQSACASDILGDLGALGEFDTCGSVSMWGGTERSRASSPACWRSCWSSRACFR